MIFILPLILGFFLTFIKSLSDLYVLSISLLITIFYYNKKNKKIKIWNFKIDKEIFYYSIVYLGANLFLASVIPIKTQSFYWDETIITFLLTSFIIPILEEIYFRGIICDCLLKNNSLKFVFIVSSLFFAFNHGASGWIFILTGSTFYYSYIYLKTMSLWNTIILHIINNTVINLILIFGPNFENIINKSLYIFYTLGFIALITCFYKLILMYHFFFREEKNTKV